MKPIEQALKRYLPKDGGALSKAMRYSVFSGGKRIRPLLVLEACKACGGRIQDALPAAAAVELVHTYSLIHDDLPAMDDDDFRRGKQTCHKVFGEANAILAGDALLTLAFYVIACEMKPSTGAKIIKELSGAIGSGGMAGGQALDLEFQARGRTTAMARKIDLLKTAKLFEAAARIGALSAGAGSREIKALGKFGLDFGLSFQMVDDYLDKGKSDLRRAAALTKRAADDLKIFGKKADDLKDLIMKLSARKR